MTAIDDRAVVHPQAALGRDVVVGPGAVVGRDVVVGDGTRIGPCCVLEGRTALGPGCTLTAHVALGTPPQDLKYRGEPTRLTVGARNTFREFVTVNRGTAGGGGETTIGDDNLFMTGSHVAHDCHVGSATVFANNATLGGHVSVLDHATMGAFTAVHQFCRIGRHAFLGGFTVVTKDVLPFMRTVGSRGDVKAYGPNAVGLRRKGFTPDVIRALADAFRALRRDRARLPQALDDLRRRHSGIAEVTELIAFIEAARTARGFHA